MTSNKGMQQTKPAFATIEAGFAADPSCSAGSRRPERHTHGSGPTMGLLLITLLVVSPCRAQEPPEAAEWRPREGASHVLGLAYESLSGPMLSAGLIVGTVPGTANKCIFGATSEGLLLQGHVGLNGPKASVGIAQYNPLASMGAKVSVLHLWRDVGKSPSGTTLIGPEVAIGFFFVRVNAGVFWRTAGPEGPSRRFVWAAGVGF